MYVYIYRLCLFSWHVQDLLQLKNISMQLIKLNEIYRGDNKSLFEDPCDFIPRSFDNGLYFVYQMFWEHWQVVIFGGYSIKYCKTLRSGNEIPHNDIVIPTWYRSFFNGFVFRFIRLILPLTVFLMLVSLFQVGAMKLVHWMNAIGRVDLTTNQISALCSVKQSDGLWCLQEEMRALECTTTSISHRIPIKHS